MKTTASVSHSTAAAALATAAVVAYAVGHAIAAPPLPAKPKPSKSPAPAAHPTPAKAAPRADGLLPTEYMPTSEIKAGMKGYGLSVFRGNKIERFDVTILGVMHKINSGRDLVLVHLGGPNMSRVTDVIAGMSGSPVYVNGRLVGAVSYGMKFTKEPMGFVTPIEDMLDSWDPGLPQSPNLEAPSAPMTGASARSVTLKSPLRIDGKIYRRIRFAAPGESAVASVRGEIVAHPCLTPVSVAGVDRAHFPKLADALRKLGLEAHQGPGSVLTPGLKGSALTPGGAIAMSLMTGDVDMTGIGTVTYRRGNRLVAFGHPFLGIGPVDAPMSTAYIHDLLPSYSESEKIGSPVQIVGAFSQDRPFSIGGRIGATPTMVPMTIHVNDRSFGREQTFHASVVRHPQITGSLAPTAIATAIDNAHGQPGNVMATIETEVVADEVGTIRHSNRVFDAADIGDAATEDLQTITALLSSNSFYPVGIRSIKLNVTIERGRRTAQVERIFLPQTRYEPGDTVEVGVVLKPYKQERIYRTLKVRIPPTTAPGTLVLTVQGGPGSGGAVRFGGLTFLPTGGGSEYGLTTNVSQLIKKFETRERNDDLVAHLALTTAAVSVGGEKFGGLPPVLDAAMRSSTRTSGIQTERDEVKVTDHTDYVLSGAQALPIRVVRHGAPPDSAGAPPVVPPAGGNPTTPPPTYPTIPATAPTDAANPPLAPAVTHETPALVPASARNAPPLVVPAKPPTVVTPTAPTTPAPVSASTPAAAPLVGRQPTIWRQSTAADFRQGTLDGVTVTSTGEITPAPRLVSVAQTIQPYFWSLAEGTDNALYAGSGDDGAIYRVANGKATVWSKTGELEVQSLVRAADGTFYAGTAPHGRIFHVTADGKATLFTQTQERYVLALALSPDGKTLYAATGGDTGRVYALPTTVIANVAPQPIYSGDEGSVNALAVAPNGSLYAGTAPDGLVVQIAGTGGTPLAKPAVLYNAREISISGLTVTADGALYAATAPRGSVYRIGLGDNAATRVVYDKTPNNGSLVGLQSTPDGTLYTATGSTLIAIDPRTGIARTFDAASDIQILSLLRSSDDTLWAATGNTAGIYRLGSDHTAGTDPSFTSAVLDTSTSARWGQIRWTGNAPQGDAISLETRSGNTPQPDATWSAWSRAYVKKVGETIDSPPARYLQYRASLLGVGDPQPAAVTANINEHPSLSSVEVYYMTPNQAPQLTLLTPRPGDALRGAASIRWTGTDPDHDTLSYSVAISADGGTTWKPLNAPTGSTYAILSPNAGVPTAVAATPANPAADLAAELAKHPEISPEMRARILADAPTADAEPAQSSPATAPASPISNTRSADFPLDTTAFPDGVYRLRVTASDRPSNPIGALTDEKISPEFRIANHAPRLVLFRSRMTTQPDGTIRLEGIAIATNVAIRGVQFRIDGGEWQAAAAQDGIFDSPSELFTVAPATALTPGHHTLEVQAVDEAGNVSFSRVDVGG